MRLLFAILKAEVDKAHQTVGVQVVKKFKRTGIQLVRLKAGMMVKEGIKRYQSLPGVKYAVPNGKEYLLGIPNDPHFGDLWGLHNIGQTGGTADADIDAPEVWDLQTGSPAVVDTGIDYTHEDLVGNIWTNPGEVPDNGIDDDGNGYVDDVYGIDTAYDDSDPFDKNAHGTHVSGTIAAAGNNGVGVAGVNWQAKIMALKAFFDEGYAWEDDIIQSLEYLLDMKARGVNVKVSSNSWGGGWHLLGDMAPPTCRDRHPELRGLGPGLRHCHGVGLRHGRRRDKLRLRCPCSLRVEGCLRQWVKAAPGRCRCHDPGPALRRKVLRGALE